ncbi:LysR family transcriptional regulator [Pseudomonas sp. NPDC090201]|uniref:LysR family transcriptional regulator n=1 Tax=Pseudomonas sp. NPDC090201 TaxID=3364475 RepID=UPI0037FF9DE5
MTINEQNFLNIDLNLMLMFSVLYRERSVTHTAKCLEVGQPAISNSLAKLRLLFNDPLFLRCGRKMRPTALADSIATVLIPALSVIEALLIDTPKAASLNIDRSSASQSDA